MNTYFTSEKEMGRNSEIMGDLQSECSQEFTFVSVHGKSKKKKTVHAGCIFNMGNLHCQETPSNLLKCK